MYELRVEEDERDKVVDTVTVADCVNRIEYTNDPIHSLLFLTLSCLANKYYFQLLWLSFKQANFYFIFNNQQGTDIVFPTLSFDGIEDIAY